MLKRKASSGDFELQTWVCALLGKKMGASEYSRALSLVQRASRKIAEFFENYDVLLTPTLAAPPPPTGAFQIKGPRLLAMKLLAGLNAGGIIRRFGDIETVASEIFQFAAYTPLFNATGQPAMSVPLYWNEAGLPIGMQFVGRYGDEATLFRLAGQLEKAKPWADKVPPTLGGI